MTSKQKTLKDAVTMDGVGLHTGNLTSMTFRPAAENTGYRFIRTDLPGSPEVPALVDNVVDIARGTTIAVGEARIHTVEHVLAAMVGMGVDNCLIELSNNEPPVGDGSSLPYVEMIQQVGLIDQAHDRQELVVEAPIRYLDEARGTEIVALPNDKYRVTVMVDYKNPALGSQHTGLFDLDTEFVTEFAPARTFCFLHEVEALYSQGLIQGGNLNNAIVIVDKEMSDEELRATLKRMGVEGNAVMGTNGILNNNALRFKNEPARHKLLDMIGDFALIGARLRAQVLAARPGHASNIEFARKVRRQYEKQQSVRRYQKSPTEGVVFDINAILKMLPHRYPFLMVDRITDYDPDNNRIVGVKNITFNEPQFTGHFPDRPIFPGVLILEAMAQTGCLLLMSKGVDPEKKLVLFTGMNNVKFRKEVTPGDQLVMELEMTRFRFNICHLVGKAFVDGKLAAEAELSAAVVDRGVAS
ncbi:MAG: bifunctional UDP-3-O-[3-hydroxymyristoyl] N-acetylglucosamine deacetylase/3-hydroxyacyl-ACP dehydratase [Ignavibacteria bacterium]|nr:bifunctional UDP-3-O-[3-hydroxymyristoyl] N-acetylglucosamine deacetylase/3-hydroxyacyl-ACP dehydratase [Ignavibacteria bacterium]MBP6509157.1 bifunctional UDP-3-O-[3-hydroxymyristoyl] N-acetylglucosamine deacetylase/3-hydroxyacyl-ACP dehydratase [Candidatus Kapabacteria bacterium]MBK6418786.1 bifunctional UDP-3-O-[3-hydroxymyristoyl] N-acetylglucosamine deacetylase/3-hydroxyacyl-ACP dehydratase [Ignavibacteria bacterium]MBK6760636.1 bifunctional UDP-3-O-[3-hydroxymyristoyl] N-acetylglucosami